MSDLESQVKRLDPVAPQEPERVNYTRMNKILTELSTGERYFIPAGLGWKWIVDNLCKDNTDPHELYKVAIGKRKQVNGWKVEIEQ